MTKHNYTGFFPYPNQWVEPIPTDEELEANQLILADDAACYTHDDYSLRVSRDGMILLRSEEIERDIKEIDETWEGDLAFAKSYDDPWAKYLQHLNVVYFLLECAMHIPHRRNHSVYYYSNLERDDLRRISYDDKFRPKSQVAYGRQHQADLWRFGKEKVPTRHGQRTGVSKEIFDDLFVLYAEVLKKNLVYEVVSVAKCVSSFKQRDYKSALLWSWIWLESHVSWLWQQHLNERGVTGDRRKRMLGRDYTVSIQIDVLELAGLISRDELGELNEVRQCRNDLVHEGELKSNRPKISRVVRSALSLVRKLFKDHYSLDLSFSPHEHGTSGL